jgi:hypothetical protein
MSGAWKKIVYNRLKDTSADSFPGKWDEGKFFSGVGVLNQQAVTGEEATIRCAMLFANILLVACL